MPLPVLAEGLLDGRTLAWGSASVLAPTGTIFQGQKSRNMHKVNELSEFVLQFCP